MLASFWHGFRSLWPPHHCQTSSRALQFWAVACNSAALAMGYSTKVYGDGSGSEGDDPYQRRAFLAQKLAIQHQLAFHEAGIVCVLQPCSARAATPARAPTVCCRRPAAGIPRPPSGCRSGTRPMGSLQASDSGQSGAGEPARHEETRRDRKGLH